MNDLKNNIRQLYSRAFNLPAIRKSRYPWVDYLRGICIIFVVYHHTLVRVDRSGLDVPKFLDDIQWIFYSFRMPLFFILSGMLVTSSLAKRTWKQLARIKFENLIYPYLIWAAIETTLQIVFADEINSQIKTYRDFIKIFYQPRALLYLWYLPALFNVTLLYLILKEKIKFKLSLHIILGVLLFFAAPYFKRVSLISDCMGHYIFFVFGVVLSRSFFKKSTQAFLIQRWLVIALLPVFIIGQVLFFRNELSFYSGTALGRAEFIFISLTGSLCMLVFSLHLQKWNALFFLRVLGYHSLYIYLMHVIVGTFSRKFFYGILEVNNTYIILFICSLVGIVIPVILYNLCIKNTAARFLFSMRKSRPSSSSIIEANKESAAMQTIQ